MRAEAILDLQPEDYLHPEKFATEYDTKPDSAKQHYEKGLEIGENYHQVHIATNGVWGASKPNETVSSYEIIGYHACTKDLLQGFIDSRCTLIVHRWDGNKVKATVIT